MPDDIDKTWMFLDRQPKNVWIELADLGINDTSKFIQLVKSCINFNYDCYFDEHYKKIKIISHL